MKKALSFTQPIRNKKKTRPIDCCYRDFLELFGHLPVYRFEKYKKPKSVDATNIRIMNEQAFHLLLDTVNEKNQ
mgnify:CR=1 FL=1